MKDWIQSFFVDKKQYSKMTETEKASANYKERLTIRIGHAEGEHVAYFAPGPKAEERCAHAVACVNACAGLRPEGIPELVKAAAGVLSQYGDYQEMSFSELRLDSALTAVKEEGKCPAK